MVKNAPNTKYPPMRHYYLLSKKVESARQEKQFYLVDWFLHRSSIFSTSRFGS
jgi:hypothetical protein